MTRSSTRACLGFGAFIALAGSFACGDVASDLITGSSGGAPGGSSAGSPTAGASSGGAATSGAGGANAGSSGTPECTLSSDCTDSERRFCHPTRRTCVECTEEAHCDSDENCSADVGECATPCASSSECVDDDDRICDTVIGFCVECVRDTDCASNLCFLWQCDT